MSAIRPVVLSGGSGTRLWPISQQSRPKQFLPLIGEESLFVLTMERAARIARGARPIVVTGRVHSSSVDEQLSVPAQILIEPGPRNTAPAICAAALAADPADVLVVLPSDHLISDWEVLEDSLAHAIALAENGGVVTFGIIPDRPEEGYGWIKRGSEIEHGYQILEFVEKPSRETAVSFMAAGHHYWNSGMFIARADVILGHVARLAPEVSAAVTGSLPDRNADRVEMTGQFLDAPRISFDHAIMEKLEEAFVVPLESGWSDIGSWDAIWGAMEKDPEGNVLTGDVFALDATNSLVRSTNLPVALIGLDGVVVIETDHGVLVADRSKVQQVKAVVERLRSGRGDSD